MSWIDDIDNPEKKWLYRDYFPQDFSINTVYREPLILKLRNFLSVEECKNLIERSEGMYTRSTMIVDGKLTQNPRRTSRTAYLSDNGYSDGPYDEILEKLYKRVCILLGCMRSQIEGVMLVKYEVGEFFKEHVDYFEREEIYMDGGGQRIATFFVYLNDMEEEDGGSTLFPEIGLKSIPEKGSALFWWNESDGRLLTETKHAGEVVKKNVKYGLNLWVRYPGW